MLKSISSLQSFCACSIIKNTIFYKKEKKKIHDDMYIKIKIQFNDLKELEYVKQYEFSGFFFLH